MPRKNQEQPDVPPFEYRAGVTIPAIGGMYRRGDPSQIPPHRLHLGVNIRLADGETGSRDGLAHVEGTTEDACITGIFEIEDFAVGAYITKLNVAAPGFNIVAFNEEKTPTTRNYWDEVATFAKLEPGPWRIVQPFPTDSFNSFQRQNDKLLIANGTKLYEAEFSEDNDSARMDLTQLFELPATAGGNIVSTCVRRERVDDAQSGSQFDKDVLYMGVEGGEVWRYDGTTVELVHTLAAGGRMQVLCYGGSGVIAAGDSAAGFSYQEQPGFAWVDQAWGVDFNCNGLCEFLGEVVFVGDRTDGVSWIADAMHWNGTGAPVSFTTQGTFAALGDDARFRNPVVAGGALHWLLFQQESVTPPSSCDVFIARWTDFATGSNIWAPAGQTDNPGDFGFFVPFAGGMLMFTHSSAPGPSWPAGNVIVLVFSGAVADFDVIAVLASTGNGYEAIQL